MRYFTSDQHFAHANIIGYCGRPYATVMTDITKPFAVNLYGSHRHAPWAMEAGMLHGCGAYNEVMKWD